MRFIDLLPGFDICAFARLARPHRSRFFASSSIMALIASGVMLVSPRSKAILSSLPVKAKGTE
jgi:hypothetical protein